MKHLFSALVLGSMILLFFTHCVEIIEFDTTLEGGQLVVDGSIATGEGPFELYLGETAAVKRKTFPVDMATITIFNDEGRSENYLGQGDGKYILPGAIIKGEIGRTYFIRIELANGRVYESRPEVLPPIRGQLDSIYFDFENQEELNEYGNIITFPVVNAKVDMVIEQQPEQNSFFRFDVEEVFLLSPTDFPDPFGVIPPPCYIYVYPNARSFQLAEVKGDQVRKLKDLKVATQILDWRFEEKHYFNVYAQSLTKEAHTFWSQVDQTISNVGTIFDTPPAPIRGNIFNVSDPDEQVLGYFSAVSRDTIRGFLTPGETPRRPLFECQFYPFNSDYPDRCLNCLSVPGSTYERPDYF